MIEVSFEDFIEAVLKCSPELERRDFYNDGGFNYWVTDRVRDCYYEYQRLPDEWIFVSAGLRGEGRTLEEAKGNLKSYA